MQRHGVISNLILGLVVVTMSLKIITGLYLRKHKVYEIETWKGHLSEGVGVHCHDVTLILPSTCCDLDL